MRARAIIAGYLEPLQNPAYRRFVVASVIVSVSSWVFYTAQTWSFLASSGTAAASKASAAKRRSGALISA